MTKHTVLLTGGAGFIGSNFIINVLKRFNSLNIINLDKLTYAGNLNNLKEVSKNKRYRFEKGDICNRLFVDKLFKKYAFDVVVNFAAESHVDRSILKPGSFVKTNIVGTQILLDAIKANPVKKFIQISTDEVYGEKRKGKSKEFDILNPNNPYSASKACADLLCRSYTKTFGLPVIIVRLSNNYGPYQFPEKLVPLMILNAINYKHLPVYGSGKNIRDWMYVEDSCNAIIKIIKQGEPGEVYNIGAGNLQSNIKFVQKICRLVSKKIKISSEEILSRIEYIADRPAHDARYCLDTSKIYNETGWTPKTDLDRGLEKTVNWYLNNKTWVTNVMNKDYLKYYKLNYTNR